MRRILSLVAFSAVFSILALAENWSGKLLDATCYDQQKNAASCDATSKTTTFALAVGSNVYKFDAAGSSKASSALRNRADRAADPAKPESKAVMAKVEGTEQGGTIKVDKIDVQ
ncbi:MAG: hypothetical protein L0338_33375 [Acidobacteria bacterium]|nr:hypothetical protein [Acidobacteriota bacterium]